MVDKRKTEKITAPVWADAAHTRINCRVKFAETDAELPFTASAGDVEAHGRDIFDACVRGEAGAVGEYVPALTPENARTVKEAEINAWRNAMESANYTFEHAGRTWDYGKETQARLAPSVVAAKAGILPEGFFWTDAGNNDVPMTAEALTSLSEAAEKAMFQKGLEIHLRQREMKKEVGALQSADEILAYQPGWKQA